MGFLDVGDLFGEGWEAFPWKREWCRLWILMTASLSLSVLFHFKNIFNWSISWILNKHKNPVRWVVFLLVLPSFRNFLWIALFFCDTDQSCGYINIFLHVSLNRRKPYCRSWSRWHCFDIITRPRCKLVITDSKRGDKAVVFKID